MKLNETEIIQNVVNSLIKKGYPKESIIIDYKTSSNRRIDIVVKDEEKILLVIEVKSKLDLSGNEIGYHPITRILQKESKELGADFYALTDGKDFYWLKTGKNGRPVEISDLSYNQLGGGQVKSDQYKFEILKHITEFLRNYSITGSFVFDVSVVFYYQIQTEINGNYSIEDFEQNLDPVISRLYERYNGKLSLKRIISESLDRFSNSGIRLIQEPESTVSFIDELIRTNEREWTIPRWMSDLCVKLVRVNQNDQIIDNFSKHGSFTASLFYNGNQNVSTFYSNEEDYFWVRIQHLLFNRRIGLIKYIPITEINFSKILRNKADGVIMAPPFGINTREINFKFDIPVPDNTTAFILESLELIKNEGKLIVIVPDGFLTSKALEVNRSVILEKSKLEGIISLPVNSFNSSTVKTSILIFKKMDNNYIDDVFVSSIDSVPRIDSLSSTKAPYLKEVIDKFEKVIDGREIIPDRNGFLANNLSNESWHFSKYWFKFHQVSQLNLDNTFETVPLREIVSDMYKGSRLVQDDKNPDIPFIGPSAIREMEIRSSEFSYTSLDKLPNTIIKPEKHTIVINAIGTYRGSAALIDDDNEDIFINRHIILLRPNLNRVHPGYLTMALNSAFVKEQIHDASTGSTIQMLTIKSLGEIFVPIPPYDVQRSLYNELKIKLDKVRRLRLEVNLIKTEVSNMLHKLGREVQP